MPANTPHSLTRRRFLALGAGAAAAAGLAACSTGTSPATRIGPASPAVAGAERARRATGAPVRQVSLNATVGEVDLGGTTVRTWTFDGRLPGKEIRLKRGEVLQARLSNGLPQPTSVHWHGIALRNDMDGVPDLTQAAVAPGGQFGYEFTVPDAGTYFFHPHVGVQLDRGLYAPLIVEDPADGADYDTELVVVLDDWIDGTGTDPDAVLAGLRANGMSMGGMGSMPGMGAGAMQGMGGTLLGGDAGDVTYPHLLANGRVAAAPTTFATRAGQRVRVRLINAAADTAFRVGIPGVPMRVTHTDGFPVSPRQAEAVLLGMGERIDAVITVPDAAVPLLAAAEGKDGYAQVLVQPGDRRAGVANDAALATLKTRPVLTVTDFAAADAVSLPEKNPDVMHDLALAGPSGKYVWTINGKTYDPKEGLPVHQGQRVRLRFVNMSMMYHPMHLHGHTFQVRGAGGRGPRKDTTIVLPGQTVEVDFDAGNPGQWLAHCHNAYHGEAGMMTIVSYVE
ncbi:multicopper oxidase family protein [Amycolatopsis sp. K13G38]|uniref:Multicopper oxidase family protein n=1 Tax=Amycolatopsis acididurans TaxID=2724524 RepID=A0ABX1J3H3_9PSEU|nr:multicopper oxidase family protein [Amycolatopsis acididurans]